MNPMIEFIWYCLILFSVATVTYIALQKIDYSKIFKYNSTWQIIALNIFVSISLGFLVTSGILQFMNLILSMFN